MASRMGAVVDGTIYKGGGTIMRLFCGLKGTTWRFPSNIVDG
jgi:hypothetical protein